jgi:hypothetical protein
VFAKLAVVRTKGSEKMGVNVEFTGDLAVDEDGNNDFRFGFERTGKVARVGIDLVHNDGFTFGGGSATNALIQRDASVGGIVPLKGPRTSMSRSASFWSM